MTTLSNKQETSSTLREGRILTVSPVGGTALVVRIDAGVELDRANVADGVPASFGPYTKDIQYRVVSFDGVTTVSESESVSRDYLNTTESAAAYQPIIGNDVLFLNAAGVPVDYTDGTPPATGEGLAGIGSLCADRTNGNLYINGGTKAQPIWKLVTRAV